MTFVEFLEKNGKLNHDQTIEISSLIQMSHEKAGQLILRKNFLPKNELLEQLQVFVESKHKAS